MRITTRFIPGLNLSRITAPGERGVLLQFKSRSGLCSCCYHNIKPISVLFGPDLTFAVDWALTPIMYVSVLMCAEVPLGHAVPPRGSQPARQLQQEPLPDAGGM